MSNAMAHFQRAAVLAAIISFAVAIGARTAHAEIPAGYTGTPYKGMPQVIPGRIEFENLDVGMVGVTFLHHNLANDASGADYRPGDKVPPICKTNAISVDKRTDGTPYPSAAMMTSYYVCQTHPGEWVKMTVNVQQSGTYHLSTAFASNQANINITLNDNGVDKVSKLNLAATADYHIWKSYDDFATVKLDAGLQVLQFISNLGGLQYDYLEFKLEGAPAPDGGGPAPSDAAVGGGSDAPADETAGPIAGSGGNGGGIVDAGTDASAPGGSGGAGGSTPPASGGSGSNPPGQTSASSGCALAPGPPDGEAFGPWPSLILALGAFIAGRRRRG